MSNSKTPPNGDIKWQDGTSTTMNRHRSPEALSREYGMQQAPGLPPHRMAGPPPQQPAAAGTSPYHRSITHINRTKSLSRPERQRPRTGMIHRHPSARHQQAKNLVDTQRFSTQQHTRNQPMSNHLQAQLEYQKQQQQLINGAAGSGSTSIMAAPVAEPPKEKEPKVLTSWWAWSAYLITCCFPSYIIRVWFGKTNKNMQQAWREKVNYDIIFLCVYF